MNKKLIALALAALPAAAMADVTIYGTIAAGVESLKTYNANTASFGGAPQAGNLQSRTEINDWVSKIGFKGSEDLGNGLKAIWQVESRLNMDGSNSSNTLATRDSFIGFAGDGWGKVRVGKLSDYANSDMEQVDPGHYSNNGGANYGGAPSVGGLAMFTRIDGRHKNAIRYDSPNWSGFSYTALYATDEARVKAADGSTTNNQFINIGLSYENSGFFGKYNFGSWGDPSKISGGSLKDWHRLEAGYNANNIYVAFGFQQARGYVGTTVDGTGKINGLVDGGGLFYNSNAIAGSLTGFASDNPGVTSSGVLQLARTREIALTGGYTFGAFTPYLSYAKGYNVNLSGFGDLNKTGYDQWVLGLDYALSKRTDIYTSYGHVNWKQTGSQNESSFGLGVIHNF
ncbi:porin [Chromobacterium sinusclupearum]|uniref:Porin n=1 Tax=Chromobacterium sinusclupearum TaxID=2077146 RepID=A0A2K4MUY1_9NEIS|nr:porin [Chromobacterium sinusclupearum]POB00656.1 porin [Chromobacterium sinusclupearum]